MKTVLWFYTLCDSGYFNRNGTLIGTNNLLKIAEKQNSVELLLERGPEKLFNILVAPGFRKCGVFIGKTEIQLNRKV